MPRKRVTTSPNGGVLTSYSNGYTREPDPMKSVFAVPITARKAGNFTVTAVHPVIDLIPHASASSQIQEVEGGAYEGSRHE